MLLNPVSNCPIWHYAPGPFHPDHSAFTVSYSVVICRVHAASYADPFMTRDLAQMAACLFLVCMCVSIAAHDAADADAVVTEALTMCSTCLLHP